MTSTDGVSTDLVPSRDVPPLPEAGTLPPVMDLLQQNIADVTRHFVGYLLAGLGLQLVVFPVVLLGLVGVSLSMLPGIVVDEPLVSLLGLAAAMLLYMLALLVLLTPLTASLMRGMWAHVSEGEPLGLGAAFSTATRDLGAVLLCQALYLAAALLGLLACYVGALVASLFLTLAMPGVVVHRLGALDAIRQSVAHVRANFKWHLGFWGLSFAILLVAQNIPLIGPMVGLPFYFAFVLRGYAAAFGSGPEPLPVQAA